MAVSIICVNHHQSESITSALWDLDKNPAHPQCRTEVATFFFPLKADLAQRILDQLKTYPLSQNQHYSDYALKGSSFSLDLTNPEIAAQFQRTDSPNQMYDIQWDHEHPETVRQKIFENIHHHVPLHFGYHLHLHLDPYENPAAFTHLLWKKHHQALLDFSEFLHAQDPVGVYEPSLRLFNDLGLPGLDIGPMEPVLSMYEKMILHKYTEAQPSLSQKNTAESQKPNDDLDPLNLEKTFHKMSRKSL